MPALQKKHKKSSVHNIKYQNLNLARLPIPPYPHILLTKLLYRILRKNQAQTEKNPERVSLRVIFS